MIIDWKEPLKYQKVTAFISGILILLCALGFVYQGGLLYGIDFTGGLRVLLEFQDPITPNQMSRIRGLFDEKLREAQLSTVSLHGEAQRRGLHVTVRGHQLVDRLTDRLYQYGRSGRASDFSKFTMSGPASILGRDILRENFHFGTKKQSETTQIDLTRAPKDRIRNRVQSIVNARLSQRIVEMLRQQFTSSSKWQIDMNSADADRIQSWLVSNQLNAFVSQFEKLRSDGQIESIKEIQPILKQFNIPPDRFESIFSVTNSNEDKLNLNTIKLKGFREIVADEFFNGRYESIARKIVKKRAEQGLYRSKKDFLSLSVLGNLYKPALKSDIGLSPFVKVRSEMISPSIGADYIGLAAMAILISLIGILVYLSIRFQFKYSLGAITAILHDVIITVGLLTLMGIRFDISVVAAVLTVIGYSLNDTIVNFDRVRENKVLMGYDSNWYDVINRSVYEVLNRTIVTSLTTLLAAVVLYFGGVALRAFAITLIIGVVAGTYSSIFIANVTLYLLQSPRS